MTQGYPDNNPKTAIGSTKVPLHLVPPSAKHYLAMAMADGAKKYGAYNFRDLAISISTYKAAAERHLDAFWDGEDLAPDSQVHHVAHAMACCALILDALSIGMLVDDRPVKGATPRLQKEYADKNKKESNERSEVLTNSVSASDCSEPLLQVAGRLGSSGDLGRDSGAVYPECSGTESRRPKFSELVGV